MLEFAGYPDSTEEQYDLGLMEVRDPERCRSWGIFAVYPDLPDIILAGYPARTHIYIFLGRM